MWIRVHGPAEAGLHVGSKNINVCIKARFGEKAESRLRRDEHVILRRLMMHLGLIKLTQIPLRVATQLLGVGRIFEMGFSHSLLHD
jgi:hypothetical protein